MIMLIELESKIVYKWMILKLNCRGRSISMSWGGSHDVMYNATNHMSIKSNLNLIINHLHIHMLTKI